MELECWTTVPLAGQSIIRNGNVLGVTEQFLVGIHNIAISCLKVRKKKPLLTSYFKTDSTSITLFCLLLIARLG